MSMFPGADAEIYRNEAGEPVGWDYPSRGEPEYCGICGGSHSEFECDDQPFD